MEKNHLLKNRYLYISFILILILAISWYVYEESTYYLATDRKIRHSLKFLLLIFISILGYLPYKNIKTEWAIVLWTLSHLILISIVTIIGIIDWMIGGVSYNMRNLADGIYHFIISPLPFIILFFLHYKFAKNKKGIN